MKEIIIVSILFLISIATFIISIRSFKEKGFLFNNAYIYASEQERKRMDKKPYYRQTAIVFLLFSIIFLLNGLEMIFATGWIFYIVIVIINIELIYAIASSIVIGRGKKY